MSTATTPRVRDDDPERLVARVLAARIVWVLASVCLILVLSALSVSLGARTVSMDDILAALGGRDDTVAQAAVVKRLPRTVLAILVGAALALAGATMQAITRNPVADPGILGVTSGASLAIVIGIAFVGITDPYGQMVLAVVGAAAATAFVSALGSIGRGGGSPLKLALAGAVTSTALGSLVGALMLPRVDMLPSFLSWQIGGVGGAEWHRIALAAPVLAIGALICLGSAYSMNFVALGDDTAAALGANVDRILLVSAGGAVILTGTATALAGPIGFVGLVVPHACRMLVGPDNRWLLPVSALGGASLLLASDVVGRVISPSSEEIQVGIISAVIGAPIFIGIVRRQRVREL